MKRIMGRLVPLVTIILLTLLAGCKENVKKDTLVSRNGAFYKNDTLFNIASAEFPYTRIPCEYWASRMELLKRMGVNTLSLRVPWMLHEPKEGCFDFEDEKNIRALCRMAREKGLFVWLHIGPAADEFMDMGSMPWWLLKNDSISLTPNNKPLQQSVGRFFRVLGKELSGMQLADGGPIALIQIGEPGGIYSTDKKALMQLRDSVVAAGFSTSLFTVASDAKSVRRVNIPNMYIAVDIGIKEQAMSNFVSVKKIESSMPTLCYDIDRRCMNVWGRGKPVREWHKIYMRMYELLSAMGSVNISAICGGTSFGHIAGAMVSDSVYQPYSTSFSDDAIINECGLVNEQYSTFGKTINSLLADEAFSMDGLHGVSMLNFPVQQIGLVAPLFDNLPACKLSHQPMNMEQCDFGFGAMLYEIELHRLQDGDRLLVKGVHDNAQIFVDGKPHYAIGRNDKDRLLALPSADTATLHILVDAMGRVGNIPGYKDFKGLVDVVELHRATGTVDTLANWKNYPLPADYEFVADKKFEDISGALMPGYYKTTIVKLGEGDFYLNMASWSRGEAWINGHSLGRFWNKGTETLLYVPGCWLHDGDNELIIVDWVGPAAPEVSGVRRR